MADFIQVPPKLLASIHEDGDSASSFYHTGHWLVRAFFWQRPRALFALLRKSTTSFNRCLDFGGGSGVLSPSLCAMFDEVTLLDLQTRSARAVAAHYGLDNLHIAEVDGLEYSCDGNPFDLIVAADVLEHFKELEPVVAQLGKLLEGQGVLITSLPTENFLYRILRSIFRVEKPEDHYWNAKEVGDELERQGFVAAKRLWLPLHIPLLPLFTLTAWRKK